MWKYKGVSYFLGLYGLIGLTLFMLIEMTSLYELVFCLLVYCVIPLYCAFGIWQKKATCNSLSVNTIYVAEYSLRWSRCNDS